MPKADSLFPYQVEGVQALVSQPALLLADDMGLGKTLQSIAAMASLLREGAIQSALVIVPAPLLRQWRAELTRWAPELSVVCLEGIWGERNWKWQLKKQVYLVSYDCLRNDLATARKTAWDLVILDEAQRIKNRGAHVSQACKSLPRQRAWALTGTPLENREDELASVLEFVRPQVAGAKLLSLRPGARLRQVQAQLQLRRRKVDVLKDLPPKTLVRVPLELTGRQRQVYRAAEVQMRAELDDLGAGLTLVNVLEVITKLKQICNFCPVSGDSPKLEDLRGRLSILSETGAKALVFSQWTSSAFGIERLRAELPEFRLLSYSGALDLAERARRVQKFQDEPDWQGLLISLRAGGQGLNLQAASYVFHFDRWWNPAVENQATDRSHRLGQTQPVTVYCYTTVDTIEERIEAILNRKLALFAEIVDLVSLDPSRMLTSREFFSLLDLAPPKSSAKAQKDLCSDLQERAAQILQRNRWELQLSQNRIKGLRFDELGFQEELELLVVHPNTSESTLKDFINPILGKRIVLTSGPIQEVPEGVIVWDAATIAALEGG